MTVHVDVDGRSFVNFFAIQHGPFFVFPNGLTVLSPMFSSVRIGRFVYPAVAGKVKALAQGTLIASVHALALGIPGRIFQGFVHHAFSVMHFVVSGVIKGPFGTVGRRDGRVDFAVILGRRRASILIVAVAVL